MELKSRHREHLRDVAKQAAVHTEQFCEECEQTCVDPLGAVSGVNTPANKAVNQITDEIMEENGFDPICQSDVRMDVVEAFHIEFHEFIEQKRVDSHIECFYCFEQKDGSDHIPILVTEDPTGTLTKTRQDWR